MVRSSALIKSTALLCASLLLASCGGGGGGSSSSSSSPVSVTPNPAGPTWTAGVFAAEGSFKDRCAIPRSGTNPATGNAYPDIAGSTLYENHWIRSWSNNTYLWFNELPDLDPAGFSNRLDYFDTQKTDATTASGTPVDQFHFTVNTEEYQQRVSSGNSTGYGMEVAFVSSSIPRDLRVAFTEPNLSLIHI